MESNSCADVISLAGARVCSSVMSGFASHGVTKDANLLFPVDLLVVLGAFGFGPFNCADLILCFILTVTIERAQISNDHVALSGNPSQQVIVIMDITTSILPSVCKRNQRERSVRIWTPDGCVLRVLADVAVDSDLLLDDLVSFNLKMVS